MTLSIRRRPYIDPGTGRVLFLLGVVGLTLGLIATLVAWLLVDGAFDSFEESLLLTDEALVAVADTVGVAEDVVSATATGLESVSVVIGDVEEALVATEVVLGEADVMLGETVPEAIDAVRGPLPALITSTDAITRILTGLPFIGDSVVPEPPPANSLRTIDEELADLAVQLRDPSVRLGVVGEQFADIRQELGTTGETLDFLVETVENAEAVLAGYERAASRASSIIDEEIDDLGARRLLALVLVGMFAVVIAIGNAGLIVAGRSWPVVEDLIEDSIDSDGVEPTAL
ncbi:MAG TPA: hypothetical protein VLA29_13550 [Acidimicrobiia bacterium]|nr:hypothetical protein [Acidimicrobiia bacterium]